MHPVIQEESTGCGIAASATLAQISYEQARQRAAALGIHAGDTTLWSDTRHVRSLLLDLGWQTAPGETPFTDWSSLPDHALLAIRWRIEDGLPRWHWVTFVRDQGHALVLDSKKSLKNGRRTDFWRMQPKWFIAVEPNAPAN